MKSRDFAEQLRREFTENQSDLLAQVIVDVVEESHNELVKIKDFRELKDIVKALAEAQERTDRKIEKLTEAQDKLTDAQKNTELEIKDLVRVTKTLSHQMGGIAKSIAYSLENEAYRTLPAYLKKHYDLEITEKFIRQELQGLSTVK